MLTFDANLKLYLVCVSSFTDCSKFIIQSKAVLQETFNITIVKVIINNYSGILISCVCAVRNDKWNLIQMSTRCCILGRQIRVGFSQQTVGPWVASLNRRTMRKSMWFPEIGITNGHDVECSFGHTGH